jgi:hypothetical protein
MYLQQKLKTAILSWKKQPKNVKQIKNAYKQNKIKPISCEDRTSIKYKPRKGLRSNIIYLIKFK